MKENVNFLIGKVYILKICIIFTLIYGGKENIFLKYSNFLTFFLFFFKQENIVAKFEEDNFEFYKSLTTIIKFTKINKIFTFNQEIFNKNEFIDELFKNGHSIENYKWNDIQLTAPEKFLHIYFGDLNDTKSFIEKVK